MVGIRGSSRHEEVEMDEKTLSYKERQNLSKGDFALPGKGGGPEGKQGGSYPIPDESHARNALARVSQHGSEAEKATVKAAVKRKYPGIKIGEAVLKKSKIKNKMKDAWTHSQEGPITGEQVGTYSPPIDPERTTTKKRDVWKQNFKKQTNKRLSAIIQRNKAQADSPGQRVNTRQEGAKECRQLVFRQS